MVPRFHRNSSCLDKFSLLKSVIKLEDVFSSVQCDSWVLNEFFIIDRIIAYSTSCHPSCLRSESGTDLQKKMEIVKMWKNVKLGEDAPLKLCFLFMTIKRSSICLAFYIFTLICHLFKRRYVTFRKLTTVCWPDFQSLATARWSWFSNFEWNLGFKMLILYFKVDYVFLALDLRHKFCRR